MQQIITKNQAIILGSLFPALGTVHALSDKGVDCSVCCWDRGVASWSRYAKFIRIPDPRTNDAEFLERIIELCSSLEIKPVLIPTDDYYAQALARHKTTLSEIAIPCVAKEETVELLVDQLRFCQWGAEKKISCPIAASGDAPGSLSPPLVAKPKNKSAFRIIASELDAGEFRFKLLSNEQQYSNFQRKVGDHLGLFALQEFIEGTTADMFSIGVYADANSRVLGRFVGRKVRGYPAMFGNTKVGQNDVAPQSVLDEIDRIVKYLDYSGIAEFEYRRVPGSQTFRLIEINPRCWSWVGATALSKADIPWMAYLDLTGVSVDPQTVNENPGQIKYVQIMSDMANVFLRYRWDYPSWLMGPRDWTRSIKAEKRMIVEFYRKDWPVTLVCASMLFKNGLSLLGKKLGLRAPNSQQQTD